MDGELKAGVAWPNSRFVDNANGTVTDSLTGLVWLKNGNCADDAGGVDKNFNTPENSVTWKDALIWSNNLASGLCGLTDGSSSGDWKLPNVLELESLANLGRADVANWLNTLPSPNRFTNVVNSAYWTSSTYVVDPSVAWAVNMATGAAGSTLTTKDRRLRVFPVKSVTSPSSVKVPASGQQSCWDSAGNPYLCSDPMGVGQDGEIQSGEPWPSPRYSVRSSDEVIDNLSGLIWTKSGNLIKRDYPAFAVNGDVTWQVALDFVKQLNLDNFQGHSDWRLPNRRELLSLVDYSKSVPALPALQPFDSDLESGSLSGYWSSDSVAVTPSEAWQIFFFDGDFQRAPKTFKKFVWPVRGGNLLTVTQAGTGTGNAAVAPGYLIDGIDSYFEGTVVELTAAGDPGSVFTGWSGGGCSGIGICQVTMIEAVALTATFAADVDGDGVADDIDNCPAVSNTDQADSNGNGIGDQCEELLPCEPPASMYLPARTTSGTYTLRWSGSTTGGAVYQVEESVDGGPWNLVAGNLTATALPFSGKGNGSYQYRVKASAEGYAASSWLTGSAITVQLACAASAGITVPATSIGSYAINWMPSNTTGVLYQLEEKANNSAWQPFASDISGTSYAVTNKADGSYEYRVKVTKADYADSTYRNSNSVVVKQPVATPCATPGAIYVPTSSTTGSFTVKWLRSVTAGAVYHLEERKDGGSWARVSSNMATNYIDLTGRTTGSYEYRIVATKDGFSPSGWKVSTPCAVQR